MTKKLANRTPPQKKVQPTFQDGCTCLGPLLRKALADASHDWRWRRLPSIFPSRDSGGAALFKAAFRAVISAMRAEFGKRKAAVSGRNEYELVDGCRLHLDDVRGLRRAVHSRCKAPHRPQQGRRARAVARFGRRSDARERLINETRRALQISSGSTSTAQRNTPFRLRSAGCHARSAVCSAARDAHSSSNCARCTLNTLTTVSGTAS